MRRDLASGLVDASIAEENLEVVDLVEAFLASLDLPDERTIENGSVGGNDVDNPLFA